MRFRYRLGYYMVGFAIGLFVVAAIFSGKDVRCNYFPNARVLNALSEKPFEYSQTAQQRLSEGWVSKTDVTNTLKLGDVDFSRSNIKTGSGKLYVIEGQTTKRLPILLEVINYEDKAVLKDIKKDK